ncbi:MAG: hypothetical protein WAW11_00780 [Patescibacteria group bacterium]
MKKIFTTVFASLVIVYFFSTVSFAAAIGLKDAFSDSSGINTIAKQANYDTSLPATPEFYIALAINLFFSLIGIIVVGLAIYSGILWMTARGDEAKVTKAKETLTEVIMGLLFVVGGYALSIFLLNVFT